MKRYLVFKGIQFYPDGGWNDFLGHFDTIEEAKLALEPRDFGDWWAQIIDTELEGEFVRKF